jgi:hypothetical protein
MELGGGMIGDAAQNSYSPAPTVAEIGLQPCTR